MYVSCKRGCLPLPLEGEVLPGSAGSPLDDGQFVSPQGGQYLTREGRESEASQIALSGDFGSPD